VGRDLLNADGRVGRTGALGGSLECGRASYTLLPVQFRRRVTWQPNADFDWREIVCVSEEFAAAEALRRQATEDPDEVEWVYLHKEATGQWVARRTPRHVEVRKESLWEAIVTQLFNPFGG
jgi:hypothetical protein